MKRGGARMKRTGEGGVEYTIEEGTASVGTLHRTFGHGDGGDSRGGSFHTLEMMDEEDPRDPAHPAKEVEWLSVGIGRLEANRGGGWTFEAAEGPLTPRGADRLEGEYKDLEAFVLRCIPVFGW